MNPKRVRHLSVLAVAASHASALPHSEGEEDPAMEPATSPSRPPSSPTEPSRRPNRQRARRELLDRPETLEAVCELLAEGHSLRTIAANRKLFPMENSASHLLRWLTDDPARLQRYARAREAAADLLAEEIIAIADDETTDPNSRRVRIEARKWYAGKLRPKVYGERLQQEITGTLTIEEALRQLPPPPG